MAITKMACKSQLDRAVANGLYRLLAQGAKNHGLPVSYVLAVASRETGIVNKSGDGGHGRSVMQIDDRWHKPFIVEHPDFVKDAAAYIDYGCSMLSGNIAWAQHKWPKFSSLKIAASAYNCGRGGATKGVAAGNCDLNTAHGDYGSDVMARAGVFEQLVQAVEA